MTRSTSIQHNHNSSRHLRKRKFSSQRSEERVKFSNDVENWKAILCPICMEPPHNAVLLLCSSFKKGCHPYMCNTSSLQSNCYEQYFKTAWDSMSLNVNCEEHNGGMLLCPLCRGFVVGHALHESARNSMNLLPRPCSLETCSYIGAFDELRKHAQRKHPKSRPAEVDLDRLHWWLQTELQSEVRDLLNVIDSTAVGYENGLSDEERSSNRTITGLQPITLYVTLEVLQSGASATSSWTTEDSFGSSFSNSFGSFQQRDRDLRAVIPTEPAFDGTGVATHNDGNYGSYNTREVLYSSYQVAQSRRFRLGDEMPNFLDYGNMVNSDHSDNCGVNESCDNVTSEFDAFRFQGWTTGSRSRRRRVHWGESFEDSEFGSSTAKHGSTSNCEEVIVNVGQDQQRKRRSVQWGESFEDSEFGSSTVKHGSTTNCEEKVL